MSETDPGGEKKIAILRGIVEQQKTAMDHEKFEKNNCRNNLQSLKIEVENYKEILNVLYPEKELLESRIRYLDASIEELNFHLAETSKSRQRMRSSLSWRLTASLRWMERLAQKITKK